MNMAKKDYEKAVAAAIREAGTPWTRKALSALIEALWATTHSDASHQEMVDGLALLSGMSIAALMEFRDTLPEEEVNNG